MQFKAASGANINIDTAPWKDAKQLKMAIERVLGKDIFFLIAGSFEETTRALIAMDSDANVEAALMPCLLRCTRNSAKITDETFNDVAARGDYYEIVGACIKENLRPLVEGLFSQLVAMGFLKKRESVDPKSTSETKSPSSQSA